jgi:hypothetical protein
MPGLSGTGPRGKGPRTGRGLGPCPTSKSGFKGKPKVAPSGFIGGGRRGGGRRRGVGRRFGPGLGFGRGFLKGRTGP